MNNKVSARIMAMEASFAKGRPMNIEAAASRLYLAIPGFIKGILDGTAIVFR